MRTQPNNTFDNDMHRKAEKLSRQAHIKSQTHSLYLVATDEKKAANLRKNVEDVLRQRNKKDA